MTFLRVKDLGALYTTDANEIKSGLLTAGPFGPSQAGSDVCLHP